jgi:glycosyltransferase involved in cell wall biosynthesis
VFELLEAASLLPSLSAVAAGEPAEPVVLDGAPAILWVGRLIAGKDPLTAIDAFAALADRLPDAQLHLLATDRTMEPEVRERIAGLGPAAGRVHLHPAVAHAEMPGWYLAADVYCSTSTREGSNYSLLEALAHGCAPAVSDIPPHRSIVGSVATCFPVGDSAQAALAIERASAMARETVRTDAAVRLSWAAVVAQLLEIYRSLRSQVP